jgi:hypothetical protein
VLGASLLPPGLDGGHRGAAPKPAAASPHSRSTVRDCVGPTHGRLGVFLGALCKQTKYARIFKKK